MYRKKEIFAIAIDDYDGLHCIKLDNPVGDARRLIKVLSDRYGYSIAKAPLFNDQATRAEIEGGLFGIADASYEEDVLIIFYAGHGAKDDVSQKGFWNPIDGQDKTKRSTLLWNSAVVEAIETMKFKHVLLISDSCFSGTFITRLPVSNVPATLYEADDLQSRWVLVSGGEENVKEGDAGKGSPFMISVIKFLETNKKSRFPATDLFTAVKAEVMAGWPQKPDASPLNTHTHLGGILIFESTDPTLAAAQEKLNSLFPLPSGPALFHYIPRTVSARNGDAATDLFFGVQPESKRLKDLLEQEGRIVLLGNAGSGKSRELQRLKNDLTKEPGRFIPIYKRFNTYISQDIGDYLPDEWKNIDPYMAVFILDGLDEVQPQYFGNAVRSIEAFVLANPQVRIVISCRTNFYELPENGFSGTLKSFSVYTLNDISLNEIKTYVSTVKGLDGNRFIQEVFDHHFTDLVQKPFFLEVLLHYFERHGNLAARRSAIIEEALTVQLTANREHLNATDVGRRLTPEVAFAILEKLGFVMEQMGKNYLTDPEITVVFPEPDESVLIKALPAFYHDDEQGRWQFEHNNIQEYLAARVLDQQPFAKILKRITIAGTEKIKPGWANTLSFYVSIGEDATVQQLLNWMVTHDREFILRFEPERLLDPLRIKLVLDIIQYHVDENIWFSSNKFSEEDIARIGAYAEVINRLLTDLRNPTSTPIVVSNAFRILRYINYDRFPAEKVIFQKELLRLLAKLDIPDHLAYSILNTLGDLALLTPYQVGALVQKYRTNINAYLRAGLYSLIISFGLVDQYLDVFVEGLQPENISEPTGSRSEVTLMDEQTRLLDGLTKVKTAESVIKILSLFNRPGLWRNLTRDDNRALLEYLIKQAVALYPHHPEIYGAMLAAMAECAKHFDHEECSILARFFHATQTAFTALMDNIGDSIGYSQGQLVALLAGPDEVDQIIAGYNAGTITGDQVQQIYSAINWHIGRYTHNTSLLDQLAAGFLAASGTELEKPTYTDWSAVQRETAQYSFDLLFDREKFKKAISQIYEQIGKSTISWADVVGQRHDDPDRFQVPQAVFSFLSAFFDRNDVKYPLATVIEYIDSTSYEWYIAHKAYEALLRGNEPTVSINEQQQSFIVKWVQKMTGTINLDQAIANYYDIVRVLWYFIREFKIPLPAEQLLPFSLYYDGRTKVDLHNPGTIDILLEMLPPVKVNERVLINLDQYKDETLGWLNNASYAITHRLDSAYPLVTNHLVSVTSFDYKYDELLVLWMEASGNVDAVKTVAGTAANESLRLAATKILAKMPGERAFTTGVLATLLEDEHTDADNKISAANQLMTLDDVRGLAYITNLILQGPFKLRQSDRNLGHSLKGIKSLDALPYILRLIGLALRPDLREQDRHNFFFSKILEALYSIGTQSREALDEVTSQIDKFIAENTGKLVDMEVLKVNLLKMREQYVANMDQALTLTEALAGFKEADTKI